VIDAATIGLLAAVGFVGGIISSIVGGASLITFPTMLATGLSPIVATASNSVALTPPLRKRFSAPRIARVLASQRAAMDQRCTVRL